MYKTFVLAQTSTQKKALLSIGFITLYFLLGKWSMSLAVSPGNVTPFYPSAGLAWAAFIFYGHRAIIPVFIAACITNMLPLVTDETLWNSVLSGVFIGIGEVISGLAATKIYFFFRDSGQYLRSIRDVVLFCLIAVFWVISPSIGVTSLLLNGFVTVENYQFVWMTWWLGDSIGIMLTAPLLLVLSHRQSRLDFLNNYPVTLVFIVFAVAASVLIYVNQYALLYLLIAICLFSAISLPQISVILITMAVASVSITATLNGLAGPNQTFSPIIQLWLLQLFIATTIVLSLIFWSVVHNNKLMGKKWLLAENKARLDPLTSILNRRGFDEQSRSSIEQYKNYLPMSLLLIDVDKFKVINDDFGHDAGDKVLRCFAKTIQDMVRDQDIVARIGGDEFAVVLIGKDRETALNVAERIRISSSAEKVSLSLGVELDYSVSIGVSQRKEDENDIVDWLKRTDKLLYSAKKAGRNTVIFE